ncbi:hypothetical protein BG653_03525 [Streptomyces platensis]|uniref:Uncharacterized protein n=1 Tax=Streptomyces platensis TaxID=58346 RepID=A0ABX3XWY3_STRPT|nr:hypothetical protein BG653_03525 [Streptomyces platensis]
MGAQRAQPFGQAGVVRQQGQRLGVAEDGDPRAGRQRLGGEQQPGVDQLGDRVDADHAGLAHQGGDGAVGDPDGGHRMAGRGGAVVPGALGDHHRFDGGGAAGEAGEFAGVADGLQIEDHDIGVRVLVPVLEEVVAGDVGAVAGRDEGGDTGDPAVPGAARMQSAEQGDADGAGLGEQADVAGAGHPRGERGVQPDVGSGVDQAEGVGPDQPHTVRPGLPEQGALPLPAVRARLGVPGGQHQHALDPVLAAVADRLGDAVRGDGDDGEVDRVGDLPQGADGRYVFRVEPPQVLGEGVVDGVHPAREAGVQEAAQGGAAEAAGGPAGADHGHRARGEQPLDGAGLGALLPSAHHGHGLLGRLQVELESDHAVLEGALVGVAGIREHLDHLGVRGEHLGGEPADAAFAGDGRDVLQEGGGDSAALVGVLDEEGDLGLVVVGVLGGQPLVVDPVVADGGDELAADRGGQPDPVDVVVVGETVHIAVGQARVGREEAVVLRFVRDLLVEGDQPLGVVRGDGTDPRRAAVTQHHVGFPVGRVRVLRRRLHADSVRPATDNRPGARTLGVRGRLGPRRTHGIPGLLRAPRPRRPQRRAGGPHPAA